MVGLIIDCSNYYWNLCLITSLQTILASPPVQSISPVHQSSPVIVDGLNLHIYIHMYLHVFLFQLHKPNFQDSDVSYVPCSGLTGENLVKASAVPELISWYSGPTLLTTIGNH